MGDMMIKLFSVKNYRNFKDKIVLDFSNIRDYDFNTYCIKDGLISKAMIFGKNGVGKSNLGFALFDIVSVLTDRFVTPEAKRQSLFINADSEEREVHFHYEFCFQNYNIVYDYTKIDYNTLSTERLWVNEEEVYEYDHKKNEFITKKLQLIGAETLNFEFSEEGIAILKYIANNGNIGNMHIVKVFITFVRQMLWFRSLKSNQFIGVEPRHQNPLEEIVQNGLLNDFSAFLERTTGKKYVLEESSNEINDTLRIFEVHRGKKIDFINAASNGTMALTTLFAWMHYFENVSFLWMDEFDAYYHFELSKKIVEEIMRYESIQTVFTSHNTYLLDNELLRPDVYFILNDGKIRSLSDSTFRELRESHNLEKLFRNGDFEDE